MLTTTKLYDIFHIVNGEHSDPHTVLGMHEMEEDGRKAVVVRAFLPDAAGITVIDYEKIPDGAAACRRLF